MVRFRDVDRLHDGATGQDGLAPSVEPPGILPGGIFS